MLHKTNELFMPSRSLIPGQSLILASLLMLALLTACSHKTETGPVAVRFDEDICQQCRMVISDPHFVAEIRYFPPGKRTKVAKFDDIGCAVTWLKNKPWKADKKTEIWVADYHTKKWINARTAFYTKVKVTPMGYGLGAQSTSAADSMNFTQAQQHIAYVEKHEHAHGILPDIHQQQAE